jgi:archaellum component FlaC
MDHIIYELKKIREDLDFMKLEIAEIKKGTNKMENHISFIETVYSQIKKPFHYILNTISFENKMLRNINEN